MAKSGTPRHSKPTRKPVTIEHDPAPKPKAADAVKPKPHSQAAGSRATQARAAEPVGDFAKMQAKQPGASKPETAKPASAQSPLTNPGSSKDKDTVASTNISSSKMQADPKPQPNNSEQTSKPAAAQNSRNTGANLMAGVAGGIIALAGAAALQWSNIIPSPGSHVTPEQFAHLTQDVSTLKTASFNAQPDQAEQQKLTQATELAKTTATKLDEFASTTTAKFADLQQQIDHQPMASGTQMDANLDALTARIQTLEAQLAAASSKADEASANVSSDKNTITALQEQLAAIQEKITENNRQPNMAALIAANALKNAVDRGGSYVAELETFSSLHPHDSAVEMLSQHASTGIPTINDLSAWFNPVADKIIATTNKPAPDASLWQQLIASAKGLVSVRPVGNVTGSGVGPITARIEAALHSGDLERALGEWQQLPADAKAVSQQFADQMQLRRDADQLFTRLIAQSLQSKSDATMPQAVQ